MNITRGEKYLIGFLVMYLIAYFFLIITKYALWGSDILYLVRISNNLNFHHFLSPQMGYPQGLPLLLKEGSLLSGLSSFTFAKIHIGILFIAIIYFTFLISQKIFSNMKISILSAFIVASVYPRATLMSPQYGQAVNLALILVFSFLLFLFFFEKKQKYSYLVLGFIMLIPLPFTHRPSTFIIGVIMLSYSLIFILNKKFSKEERLVFLGIFLLSILAFGAMIYIVYKGDIKLYLSHIILSRGYLEINQPTPYSNGYFMNYVGWELIPLFLLSIVVHIKYFIKRFPKIFSTFSFTVLFIAALYVGGVVILGISVSWRAANYSLYIISIIVAFTLLKLSQKSEHNRKLLYFLYAIIAVSLLLYTLDWAIQRYIYRAVTGTSPQRIKITFVGGVYAPYLIYGLILMLIIIIGIVLLYSNKHRFKSTTTKKLFSSKSLIILLIIIFILPRILMSATGFYLLPPDITDAQYKAFEYIKNHYPDAGIFSDPQTVYFAVGYGLHMRYKVGNYMFEDVAPLYGPSSKGSIPAGWARTFDKWIKNKDIRSIYNFMKESNDTLLIIDIYSGKLINMSINKPHGGYIHMPEVLMDFKNVVDKSNRFQLIYSQNYGEKIFIYRIV